MSDIDTIAAISTPLARGAIGIVRMSGPTAYSIAKRVFVPRRGRVEPFRAELGEVVDPESGEVIDIALLTYFKAPRSYTKEDVVEISAHGSPVVLREILSLLIREGARLAQPGEFTYRAFINGRLDLLQAEAVADLISATTKKQAKSALAKLSGELSSRIREVDELMLDLIARAEASLDFSEEEDEFITQKELLEGLRLLARRVRELKEAMSRGRLLKEGIALAIIGRPNVGKSSIFNRLVEKERAIVTEIPGTTRDALAEEAEIEGIPIRFVDTAGIASPRNRLDEEGMKRSLAATSEAKLILAVFDSSEPLTPEDERILSLLRDKEALLVVNKKDLPLALDLSRLKTLSEGKKMVRTSAKTGEGIEELKREIASFFSEGFSGDLILAGLRELEIVSDVEEGVASALSAAEEGEGEEIVLVDLKQAFSRLGELTGRSPVEDVLHTIFSRFCIGK